MKYFRKAFPMNDLVYNTVYKKGCFTHMWYSSRLKQVVVIKLPSRKHYIAPKQAGTYLKNSRKDVLDMLYSEKAEGVYILNILIGNQLTKSCYKLVKPGEDEHMNMIFNPKITDTDEIFSTITQALATKFRSWAESIKKSCNRPKMVYHETSKGRIRTEKRIKPYGHVKRQIADLGACCRYFRSCAL